MINPNRFSIRTLLSQGNVTKKREQCLHLIHVSQLIKDTTGSGNDYTDSHFECAKMKRRISSKRKCLNCNMYSPIIH
jgi:hypothetical protein